MNELLAPQREGHMENQHRQIKGYRELSQTEIDAMNETQAAVDRMIADGTIKFPNAKVTGA